ncbi:MAG TPA: hypothetical protein VG604_03555 [Candidatus Saccharimonadales bacterium]|nr:hypothetical protein [Candidatus Saccharimonadales bacterium]
MSPYSQNNSPYTSGGYEKARIRKLLLIVVIVFAAALIPTLVLHGSQPDSHQNKYIKSATAAARKVNPSAIVTTVKVAGGFALATVTNPTTSGQESVVYTAVFRVSQDGSMRQLASGSSFSPLDLLNLGIPLATQAKLTGSSLGQTKQNLGDQCNYTGGGLPGYSGFGGSFNPGGWQIDSATLSSLEQALSDVLKEQNAAAQPGKSVVCVIATRKNSNLSTDTKTYTSTFKLQVQFVTGDGTLTVHALTFAIGYNHYRNYTLDGHNIQ